MNDSIFNSIKKVLGVAEDYHAFDVDILMHINSTLAILNQLGVGPANGFSIEDETQTWLAFMGDDPRLNLVKSYMALKVRKDFDPPASGFLTNAITAQIDEYVWRITVAADSYDIPDHTDLSGYMRRDVYDPNAYHDDLMVVDGGSL